MMHRSAFLLVAVLFTSFGMAQMASRSGQVARAIDAKRAVGVQFPPTALFTTPERTATTDALWSGALRRANVLRLDPLATTALLQARSPFIAMELPGDEGTLTLDLERVEITTDEFNVVVASTGAATNYDAGVHYQGMIRGVPGSIAAISVFPNEVMGLVSDAGSDKVLGRFENDTEGYHVFYDDADLRGTSNAVCGTPETDFSEDGSETVMEGGAERTLKCVRFYWEVNYDIFQGKGSVVNATNYVTGLFNQSSILYANDGISVLLNEVFVWDVVSPYVQTSTSELLDQFGVTRTSFNGDLGHLLGYQGGGGIAWRNTLCNSQTYYRMAYSDVNSTFSNVPTYSWSVEVVTHEQGHNMISPHTHACSWNGNNTAIDGCGPAAGYTEGSCAQGPLPASNVGGTIMSYCHLTSSTIKFANGFGPQPTALIVNRINSMSCLTACGSTCGIPIGLNATAITNTGATLTWGSISGATSYTLQWKLSSSGTWTTVTGIAATSYALGGLTAANSYDFAVLAVCPSGSSIYSGIYTFVTTGGCVDSLEPNNSTGAAPTVALPANINALIASNGDVDYYRFTLAVISDITLTMGNLAGDYDLRLLDNTGAQLAISENGNTTNESISYPSAPAGTYYIHVFGYNGAFSATQCYVLNASAVAVPQCNTPNGLQVGNVAWNAGTASWSAVSGAVAYDLRWKLSSSGTWTNVNALVGLSYVINGLQQITSYDVQVRTVCNGSPANSSYTNTVSFITPAAPCEALPPILVRVKMLLDGAYRGTPQPMIDSLRVRGLVPLLEPYTALGYATSGTVSTNANVLATTGANGVVDWVLVELRNNANPATIVETRAALLQRDGDVVAADGSSALGFCATPGTYRVAVRHRNHLGVMTANGVALSGTSVTLDLSVSGTSTYGTNARKNVGAAWMLWAGNTNGDGSLIYAGQDNDRDPILVAVGGSVPTTTINGYLPTDVNMDGKVRYVGVDNDRDPILSNLGGSVPTNTMIEQLP